MPMVWTEVMDDGAPDLAPRFAQECPPGFSDRGRARFRHLQDQATPDASFSTIRRHSYEMLTRSSRPRIPERQRVA